MKLKPTPLYLLAFFSLVFLLHEVHDWVHVIVSGALCHCWGMRGFDTWTPCSNCTPGGNQQVVGLLIAALVINVVIWASWFLMHPGNSMRRRSIGFSLLFASLPVMRIWHACLRDADETSAFRAFFQHPRGQVAHFLVLGAALAFVLLMTLPALVRAFMLLPGWKLKLLLYPLFLFLPGLIDHWVVHDQMQQLLLSGTFPNFIMRGVPTLVMAWLLINLTVYLLTRWSLPVFLDYPDAFDL
jgi:hypothetical protein